MSSAPLLPLSPLPRMALTEHMERQVICADYGADGYTTRAQADRLAHLLDLRPGRRLLDIGCGRGWPGLYLAARTGCHVLLADLPHDALVAARARARDDRLNGQVTVVRASGHHLPLAAAVFDAVSHSDVLCCLNTKRSVLRASRRVLRPGGRTGFFTIAVPRGLSAAARRQAARAGPAAVIHHRDYRDLLRSAGFVDISAEDVTPAYLRTQYAWMHQLEQAAGQLAMLEGPTTVAERLARRRTAVAAIEAGLLQRWLLTAA